MTTYDGVDRVWTDGRTQEPHAREGARFAVIVPCYNERDSISIVVESILHSCATSGPYDLIVVDDGSTDGSAEALRCLQQRHPEVQVLTHAHNRGYGAALKSGIRHTSAELIVITDADRTYPNERIPELLAWAQRVDMVVGARQFNQAIYPRSRRIAKFFLSKYAAWIVGEAIPDINSGLRVMRRVVVEQFFHILPDTFSFTTTITVAMLTNYYTVQYVPVTYAARVGRSKIKPLRDTWRFLHLILRTGMYFAPLRVFFPVASLLGLLFLGSLAHDVLVLRDLTETTLLFLLFALNTAMLALLADMFDKRSPR
ncbi:MAG TPA: glycosyltransferase family 2 protein [Candidatus Tectomicrobia bacterium]